MQVICPPNINILEYLRSKEIFIPAYCGGAGNCGKCKVLLRGGTLDISAKDRQLLTEKELNEGWRLACTAIPKRPVRIEIAATEDTFHAITAQSESALAPSGHSVGIAVDIGTTTVAAALVDLDTQKIIDTNSRINHQRSFGADVISRIKAANEGHLSQLQSLIRQDLEQLIQSFLSQHTALDHAINRIVISANTTMQHLLLGYSCEGLGVSPFQPITLGGEVLSANKLFPHLGLNNSEVVLLKGISTYIGSDISSGLLTCPHDTDKKPFLFLDLGTNGEMALVMPDKIITASTAVGPALEGASLSCGVGSIQGAISRVTINHGVPSVQTIGDAEPIGICGSGAIEATAELLKHHIIDRTGKFSTNFAHAEFVLAVNPSNEKIKLTQQDIREIQLAKGAVRAGIEVLLQKADIKPDELQAVYIAGGFGSYLNPQAAAEIGLIPPSLAHKTQSVGNTSLGGAIQFLTDTATPQKIQQIINTSSEIILGNDTHFQDLFIDNINFPNTERNEP